MEPTIPPVGHKHVNALLDSLRQDDLRKSRNQSRPKGAAPRAPNFTFNFPSLPVGIIESSPSTPASSRYNLPGGPSSSIVVDQGAPRAMPQRHNVRRNLGFQAPPSWTAQPSPSSTLGVKNMPNANKHGKLTGSRWRYSALALGWKSIGPSIPMPPPAPPSSKSDVDPTFRDLGDGDLEIPSLVQLSLRALFTPRGRIASPQLSTLPLHLLMLISRYAAVARPKVLYHSPQILHCSDDEYEEGEEWMTVLDVLAGVGGEFVFVGEGETKDAELVKAHLTLATRGTDESVVSESWEDDPELPSSSLYPAPLMPLALTIVTLMHLPSSSVITLIPLLPQTVTHLSLLSFSTPVNHVPPTTLSSNPFLLKKLSRKLPRLEFLDVSFNSWITLEMMYRVEWHVAWPQLRLLGLRGCDSFVEEGRRTPPPFLKYRYLKQEHVVLRPPHHNLLEALSASMNAQRLRMWIDIAY